MGLRSTLILSGGRLSSLATTACVPLLPDFFDFAGALSAAQTLKPAVPAHVRAKMRVNTRVGDEEVFMAGRIDGEARLTFMPVIRFRITDSATGKRRVVIQKLPIRLMKQEATKLEIWSNPFLA